MITKGDFNYIKTFSFTLIFIILLSVLICWYFESKITAQSVDFTSLDKSSIIVPIGINIDSYIYYKLNYLQKGKSYNTGFFSDHTGGLYTQEVFSNSGTDDFFNYHSTLITLPQLNKLFSWAVQDEVNLPKNIIIQIENPLVAGGNRLIDNTFIAMPPSIKNINMIRLYELILSSFKISLNWQTYYNLMLRDDVGGAIIDINSCEPYSVNSTVEIISFIGDKNNLENAQNKLNILCSKNDLRGYYKDGSEKYRPILRNQKSHKWHNINMGVLKVEDFDKIKETIVGINDLLKQSNKNVIFIVPPVLNESLDFPINRYFTKSVEELLEEDIIILDYRAKYQNEEYFHGDDEHPNEKFYKQVSLDLKVNKLLLN